MKTKKPTSSYKSIKLRDWCWRAAMLDAAMHREGGTRKLSRFGLLRLAVQLQNLDAMVAISLVFDQVPSSSAVLREIEKIRKSVHLIAGFGKTRAEKGAIDKLGDAASKWHAENRSDENQHLFFAPQKVGEEYTDWYGDVFIRQWLEATRIVNSILKIGVQTNTAKFAWGGQKTTTELQGRLLIDLYKKTYPGVGFGGRQAEILKGSGYLFVSLAMQALGFNKPSYETIQSACKRLA